MGMVKAERVVVHTDHIGIWFSFSFWEMMILKNKYFLVWYFSGSNVGERSLSKRAAFVFLCKILGI